MIMFLHVLRCDLPFIIRAFVFKINHTSVWLAGMMILPDPICSLYAEAKIVRAWRAGIQRKNDCFTIRSLNLCTNDVALPEFDFCIRMILSSFWMLYDIPVSSPRLGGNGR